MFIELTDKQTSFPISLNISQIVQYWKCNEYCGIDTTSHTFVNSIFVKESYEEVKEKIERRITHGSIL